MRSKLVLFGLGALALVATANTAVAQKPVSFGLAAGVSMPMGDFKDAANTGLNGTVLVGLGLPMLPVGVRLEGSYNRFAFSDANAAAAGEKGNVTISSATANVTFGLPGVVVLSPYVIAGAGMYWTGCDISGNNACNSKSDLGFNGGVGIKLRALVASAFLEARYHSVQTEGKATNYVPITIGFMF
jgi:hypothetical protein